MSVQVHNNFHGGIGRMFARQNVSALYEGAKSREAAAPEAGAGILDKVSLSGQVPRPFEARFLEEAADAGRRMGRGGALSGDELARLREDRVFGAMSVLAAIGDDGSPESLKRSWPGGLPTPTREELEAARRRLAQRLDGLDGTDDSARVQDTRLRLLERIGRRDLGEIAMGDPSVAAVAASA